MVQFLINPYIFIVLICSLLLSCNISFVWETITLFVWMIVCTYTCKLASLCIRSSEVRFGQHNKTSTGNRVNLFLLRSTTCKFSIDYNRNAHITVYKYIIVIISHGRFFTGIKFGIFIAWRYYVNHFGKL